jgi:hypothetical protein
MIGRKDGKGIASTHLSYLENQHPGPQEIKSRKLSNIKIKLLGGENSPLALVKEVQSALLI